MKKTLICLILVLSVLCMAGCGDAVKVGSFKSAIYNADEFQDAVNAVLEYFNGFEGCTMKEIRYAGDDTVKAESEARGVPSDRIIVLESTFTTDSKNHENGLEPDFTYENYQWTFTRDFTGGPWNHLDHGYG